MPPVPEIVQRLETPLLDLVEKGRDPAFVGRFDLGNRMQRSLAHLAATTGRFSKLLRCDDDGKLHVVESALAGVDVTASNAAAAADSGLVVSSYYLKQLFDTLVTAKGPLKIVDSGGSYVLDIDSDNALKAGLHWGGNAAEVLLADAATAGHYGLVVSNYALKQIADVLADVHDPELHALKTIEQT